MKKFLIFFLMLLPLAMASCGGDGKDEPQSTANDPEGTILMYLYHDESVQYAHFVGPGYNVGDWVEVTESNNFSSWNGQIASVGKVKGIADIKSVPNSGWAKRTAIVPGNGYVAKASYDGKIAYGRFYVVDFITSTDGGIIGAIVKYQEDWQP